MGYAIFSNPDGSDEINAGSEIEEIVGESAKTAAEEMKLTPEQKKTVFKLILQGLKVLITFLLKKIV